MSRLNPAQCAILTSLVGLSAVLYLHRMCVNFASTAIMQEFRAPGYEGWFLGAFFWSYALSQVPAGLLSDRWGVRHSLATYAILWSAFTCVLGWTNSLWMLITLRMLTGLSQAGAYPAAARAVREWMPLVWRGTASSWVSLGGRLGGAIAPLLTALIMSFWAMSLREPYFTADDILDRQQLKVSLPRGVTLSPASTWTPSEVAHWLNSSALEEALMSLSQQERAQLPSRVQALLHRAVTRRNTDDYERNRWRLTSWEQRQLWEQLCPKGVRKFESYGWRGTMVMLGLLGLVMAIGFWVIFRDRPEEHPWCPMASVEPTTPKSPPTSLRQALKGILLGRAGMWGNCCAQLGTNVGWVFLVTLLPRYLEEVHHLPVLERGLWASLPTFVALPALLLGGMWTDRLTVTWGRCWGRRVPLLLTRVGCLAGYLLCWAGLNGVVGPVDERPALLLAMLGFCLVSLFTDLGMPAVWAYSQDVGGSATALVLGWGNTWGNLGAAVAPVLYVAVLGAHPDVLDWRRVLAVCMAGFGLAVCGAWFMDASRSLHD
ncbi:MAG: hypothetical protein KatS3mg113_0306 [Planctomycetaceae bacterium]|nr:MAG: hypothetical protein KatS3mg113_0306 [Planctomycetaceae bacterium]